jgi:hypothetical protein
MNKEIRDQLRKYLLENGDLNEITGAYDTGYNDGWEACKRHIYTTFMLDDDMQEIVYYQADTNCDFDISLDQCCADNCCPTDFSEF